MRHDPFRIVLILCALLVGLVLLPGTSSAQPATPTAESSVFPPEFCAPEEIGAAHEGIAESPLDGALVSPASAPGMDLYVVQITLDPGTCVSYTGHFLHDGAAVWLVDAGEIIFDFQLIQHRPVPDLALQPKDGARKSVTPMMHLAAGDWVSADRAVHYSYRNAGQEPAVVIMTVLENRWIFTGNEYDPVLTGVTDCKGICRNPRR